MVSSLSQKKQSIKINHDGVEVGWNSCSTGQSVGLFWHILLLQVFREFFPVSEDFVILECVWESDKFILLERKSKRENASPIEDSGGNVSVQASAVNYESIESCLGGKNLDDVFLFPLFDHHLIIYCVLSSSILLFDG